MMKSARQRILLTTFGSFGDLHPFLAVATGLRDRGYQPVIATVDSYRQKVEAAGLEFRLLRTANIDHADRDLIRNVFDMKHGAEFLIRKLVMPSLRTAYMDTLVAARDCDLLVSHPLTMATRLVAETHGIPWASTHLAPMGFLSPYDPPIFSFAPLLAPLRGLGPILFRPLLALVKHSASAWTTPYRQLRAALGLPRADNPLFEDSYSPSLVLALFSGQLAARQPDWPAQTVLTGFPFHDDGSALSPELQRFLDAGEPPIIFTLGSAAVHDSGSFYQESAEAARLLGHRAVLLVGSDPANRPPNLPEGVAAFDYAPFSKLFPRAAAVVHQGGVGTTGEAMRAGKPMLVMPYAIDQPDNADRVQRLGIGRVVYREEYSAARAAHELNELLTQPDYRTRTAQIAQAMSHEDGVAEACRRLEALLEQAHPTYAVQSAPLEYASITR
jgi:UDP:flavonoid glycosyltransferase YjiC (YdhE family)